MNVRACLRCVEVAVFLGLAGCAHVPGAPGPDSVIREALESAAAAIREGDYEAAVRHQRRALMQALRRDEAQRVAQIRYQMAACRMAQGRFAEAARLLPGARDEALLAGDEAGAAQAEIAWARLLMASDRDPEAEPLLHSALARVAARRAGSVATEARLALSELARRRQNAAEIRKQVQAIEEHEAGRMSLYLHAERARLLAEAAAIEGDFRAAAEGFDQAQVAFRRVGRFDESAAALEAAAHAWHQSGDTVHAARGLYRAARIRQGLGQRDRAASLADTCARWAREAGDTLLLRGIESEIGLE